MQKLYFPPAPVLPRDEFNKQARNLDQGGALPQPLINMRKTRSGAHQCANKERCLDPNPSRRFRWPFALCWACRQIQKEDLELIPEFRREETSGGIKSINTRGMFGHAGRDRRKIGNAARKNVRGV